MITSLTPSPVLPPAPPMSLLIPSQFDTLFICICIWKHSLPAVSIWCGLCIHGFRDDPSVLNSKLSLSQQLLLSIVLGLGWSPGTFPLWLEDVYRYYHCSGFVLCRQPYFWGVMGVTFLSFPEDTISQSIFLVLQLWDLPGHSMMFPNP